MKTITTFYSFIDIPNCEEFKFELERFCLNHSMLGTVLVATEGFNGTLYGDLADIELFESFLKNLADLPNLDFKRSETDVKAFDRLKIRIKPEIITFKHNVDVKNNRGEYLDPDSWNKYIDDPKTILLDTRNDYEYEMGTFEGAINPDIENFSDLPEWLDKNLKEDDKEKNVLMFCTGGVRCEKSTAYLKKCGYKNVFHLEGGIIKYLQNEEKQQDKWHGECFVFDNRIFVDSESV